MWGTLLTNPPATRLIRWLDGEAEELSFCLIWSTYLYYSYLDLLSHSANANRLCIYCLCVVITFVCYHLFVTKLHQKAKTNYLLTYLAKKQILMYTYIYIYIYYISLYLFLSQFLWYFMINYMYLIINNMNPNIFLFFRSYEKANNYKKVWWLIGSWLDALIYTHRICNLYSRLRSAAHWPALVSISRGRWPTPFSLARAWTVFLMVSVGMMSELSPVK